jgi:RNA polymerase sigma-70 factor (sigma-E family)
VTPPGPTAADPDGFAALFDEQRRRMVALARLLLGDAGHAEEVVQDAFVELHLRWDKVRDPVPYLRRAVVNGCRSRQRRAAVLARKLPLLRPTAASTDQPDELADAIAALPHRQRVAIVLRYYEDLAERDVALAMRCSPAAVKSLLHRAIRTLRVDLDDDVPAAPGAPGTAAAHGDDDSGGTPNRTLVEHEGSVPTTGPLNARRGTGRTVRTGTAEPRPG